MTIECSIGNFRMDDLVNWRFVDSTGSNRGSKIRDDAKRLSASNLIAEMDAMNWTANKLLADLTIRKAVLLKNMIIVQ